MSFCHAIEVRRRELEKKGDLEALAKLPSVSAFERSSTHGGVWKQQHNSSTTVGDDTSMYEGMWVNGAKELAEYFDYTYDEHFGCALPPYIQRGAILEYMTARVTKNTPDFFEKYVTFNTDVVTVTFDNATEIFTAITKNLLTGEKETSTYDKVIWAAGVNSIPYIPQTLENALDSFDGKMIHSSNVSNLKGSIKGKRVLLIGGASSAEDIALTSLKLGAEEIFISFRNPDDSVAAVYTWPLDKVKGFKETVPSGVDENNCIILRVIKPSQNVTILYDTKKTKEVSKDDDADDSSDGEEDSSDNEEDSSDNEEDSSDNEEESSDDEEDSSDNEEEDDDEEAKDDEEEEDVEKEKEIKLCGIDTVIFCTGYKADFGMLDPSINGLGEQNIDLYAGPILPPIKDWEMTENVLTKYIGDIQPANKLDYWKKRPYLYQYSVSIENPSMMYLVPNAVSLDQILWADVLAWHVLAFITEEPSSRATQDEMIKWLSKRIHHEMQIPALRDDVDANYHNALKKLDTSYNFTKKEEFSWERGEVVFTFRALAETMEKAGYPVDIGSFEELNDIGMQYVDFETQDRDTCVGEKPDSSKTFRDLKESNLKHIRSVFTGTQAVPFKKLWMEIDDLNDTVMDLCGVDEPNPKNGMVCRMEGRECELSWFEDMMSK
eukprot:scaffold13863_cov59-Attheya_sp.AAC.1